MSALAPEPIDVASPEDVELLVRDARAAIAQLTLRLRSVRDEIEAVEREVSSPDDVAARELLRTSLDDVVAQRRRELERELEEERALAVEAVTEARRRADAARPPATSAVPPRRLQLVDLTNTTPAPVRDEPLRPEPTTELTPERLAPLVEAAVTAAIAGVAASTRSTVALTSPIATTPLPREVADQRPVWRRFLYVDVMLPLVAVLIVVFVLFAWAG